jgi:hypothetical protein
MKKLLLLFTCLTSPALACSPNNAPAHSVGCMPTVTTVQPTDLVEGWRTSLFPQSDVTMTVQQIINLAGSSQYMPFSGGTFTSTVQMNVPLGLSSGGTGVTNLSSLATNLINTGQFDAILNDPGSTQYMPYSGGTFTGTVNMNVPLSLASGGTGVTGLTALQTLLGAPFVPIISTNAALKAFTHTNMTPVVYRAGFNSAGDGGAVYYNWSASSCSLNSGAGDNGSQVKPTSGGGCWLADLGAIRPTPMIWGAVGDGIADDTTAVQAALTALGYNGELYTGNHLYGISATLRPLPGEAIVGPSMQGRQNVFPPFTFVPLTTNLTTFSLVTGNRLEHLAINQGGPGLSTSGFAIAMPADGTGPADILVNDVYISGGCVGMEINGNSNRVVNSMLVGMSGTGCGGIIIGDQTTGAITTGPMVLNTVIATHNTSPASYCIKIEDGGGVVLDNTDSLFCTIGLYIYPGANQWVPWLFAHDTALGDTTAGTGVFIDTAAASAKVSGLTFNDDWASNNPGSGVVIQNTGGGEISGLAFNGFRAYGNTNNAFDIAGNVTNISINESRICGVPGTASGVYIHDGVGKGEIHNSTIGGACDSFTGLGSIGIAFAGTSADWSVTGNNVKANTTPIYGTPTGDSVVRDNIGVDTAIPTLSSGANLIPGANPIFKVTGTTTVTAIGNYWNGRQLTIIPNGSLPFAGGGNICNALTAAANVPVQATYTGSCWALK